MLLRSLWNSKDFEIWTLGAGLIIGSFPSKYLQTQRKHQRRRTTLSLTLNLLEPSLSLWEREALNNIEGFKFTFFSLHHLYAIALCSVMAMLYHVLWNSKDSEFCGNVRRVGRRFRLFSRTHVFRHTSTLRAPTLRAGLITAASHMYTGTQAHKYTGTQYTVHRYTGGGKCFHSSFPSWP